VDNVVGLSLESARRALGTAGIDIEAIEIAQPPGGTGRPLPPDAPSKMFVATQWATESGGVRLRAVSVPATPRE